MAQATPASTPKNDWPGILTSSKLMNEPTEIVHDRHWEDQRDRATPRNEHDFVVVVSATVAEMMS